MHAVTQIIQTAFSDWGALHPLIVHFPIALLFISPLFVVLGLIKSKYEKPFFLTALILLAVGWLFSLVAVSTGEQAAEHLSNLPPNVVETLDEHYHLAERVRLTFGLLTAAFLAYFCFYNKLLIKTKSKTRLVGILIFLLLYFSQLLVLTEAAHHGAELVHEYGIKSTMFEHEHH